MRDTFEAFYRDLTEPGALVVTLGHVTSIGPMGVVVEGLSRVVSLEDIVQIGEQETHRAEVVHVDGKQIVVKPLDVASQIKLGDEVRAAGRPRFFPSAAWKGRIISAVAEPLDGKGALPKGARGMGYDGTVLPAMGRAAVEKKLRTGIHAVDVFTPLCHGQRIGIFAGSGVGKSTLLGMMATAHEFDTVVVALVGERGREVTEFIHEVLGPALEKSVVVVATGDEAAPMRKRAALLATTIAESFRDEGKNVLLLMDSVTRFAQAQRDIALAGGEPPVSRGFPPSVFSALPQLLERSGPGLKGSGTITGIYAVLVDGDNHNEPVADAVRGTLDGHIVLSRAIAATGRFPALDMLQSISRLSHKALDRNEAAAANEIRALVARFEDTRDLRSLGSYQPGRDAELDRAIALVPQVYRYFTQGPGAAALREPFADMAALLRPAAK